LFITSPRDVTIARLVRRARLGAHELALLDDGPAEEEVARPAGHDPVVPVLAGLGAHRAALRLGPASGRRKELLLLFLLLLFLLVGVLVVLRRVEEGEVGS
jgi:hypothetical protein